jgi:hypothetical protein
VVYNGCSRTGADASHPVQKGLTGKEEALKTMGIIEYWKVVKIALPPDKRFVIAMTL